MIVDRTTVMEPVELPVIATCQEGRYSIRSKSDPDTIDVLGSATTRT
jgi:hypothetical protein